MELVLNHQLIDMTERMLQTKQPKQMQDDAYAILTHLMSLESGRARSFMSLLLRVRPRLFGAKASDV